MKYYCVVRLNPRDAAHSTSKALPVRFTDRAQAEEICAELNRTKPKKKATQVSLSKNAKNPDVCFRNRLDCWSIEARKIQTAGSQESFDSAFERICATHHSSPSALDKICYRLRDGEPVMQETFRLELNQAWEAIDIKTGAAVIIPKGSHKAVRILHHTARDPKEEPWLVVTMQHHLPGHTTVDLALGKNIGERPSVSLTALNLANRRFLLDNSLTFAGGSHFFHPREIFAQVKYRFHY